jgi:hypothetical protein
MASTTNQRTTLGVPTTDLIDTLALAAIKWYFESNSSLVGGAAKSSSFTSVQQVQWSALQNPATPHEY